MHFQSPPFWWLMTTRLKLTKRYKQLGFWIQWFMRGSPLMCAIWIEFINDLKCQFAHTKTHRRPPLNHCIRGVQVCVKIKNRDAYDMIYHTRLNRKHHTIQSHSKTCMVLMKVNTSYISHTYIYITHIALITKISQDISLPLS